MRHPHSLAGLALALGAMIAPASVAAQQPTDSAAAAVVPAAPAIRVVPVRSEDFLRRALDDARMHQEEAEATLARAADEREQSKARIEVKKRELSTIEARRKLADKEKNESAKIGLQGEKRAAESEKKLAERLDAVYESEIELAKKARDLARADQRALDLELELAARRNERDRVAQTDPASIQRLEQVIVTLEGRVLEARRDRAGVAKDVAGREQKIAERRIALHKAHLEASGLRGR
jgi:hypothetical protein